VRRIERFKGILLSTLIIASLTLSVIAVTSILSTSSVSASPNGYEIIIRGKGTAYNVDFTDDEPWVWYALGDLPPIMAAKRIGSGAVVAAGTAHTCRDVPEPCKWIEGEWDVLLDIAFKWMKPSTTKVLWYGNDVAGDNDYNVYNNPTRCSKLIDNLRAKGYTVDNTVDGAFTSIASALTSKNPDILIIPSMGLGAWGTGGDPSLLPWSDVQAIKNFVEGGGGLLIMDGCDFAGGNCYKVQNKILLALNMGIYFQSDEIYDNTNYWWGWPWWPIADVDTGSGIGAAYLAATGKTDIKLFSLCTLAEPAPAPVGGTAFPADKLALLAPWIILAALIAIGTVSVTVYWRRYRS